MKTIDRTFLVDGRMRTAPAILFEAARAFPNETRFEADGRSLTLADLAREVRSYAGWLRRIGVGPGDRVALFAPNSVAWIAGGLGVQTLGAAFVGIHAGSSADLVRYILAHSEARALLTTRCELARAGIADPGVPVIYLDDPPPPLAAPEVGDLSSLDGMACIIYTSGTTGRPKGVVLSHRNLAANAADWLQVCGPVLPDAPREVLWLPFSHIFGWGAACIGNLVGFRSRLAGPFEVPAALAEVRPHVLMTVPILLERLVHAAGGDAETLSRLTGGRLRLCLAGGAALAREVKERFLDAGIPVLEGYGLTETSPTLTLTCPDRAAEELETVGHPYPSVEIRVASDGEVLARGPNVFSGYWRDPEATAKVIDEAGWFHTGDIGRLTASGALRIVDRKNAVMVLSNGKNVAPQPIEARAAAHPWIARLVLFGHGRPAVCGLVVPDTERISADLGRPVDLAAAGTDEEIRAGLGAALVALNAESSRYERIRAVRIATTPLTVEAGHLTASFKVRRRAVGAAFAGEIDLLFTLDRDGGPNLLLRERTPEPIGTTGTKG